MNAFWHRLRFFAVDAWDELRHSPGVNLLAAGTLIAVLFGSGLLVLVLSNIEVFVAELRDDVRIEVYLVEDITDEQRNALLQELRSIDGVAEVERIDKDEALDRYKSWAGEMATLVDDLEANPLPESLEVFLTAGPDAQALGSRIRDEFGAKAGVEQARFDRSLLGRIEALLNIARLGGGALGLMILSAVVFVMASVLRLAVYARRDEIEIMLLVGATPMFVRGPFLVAGVVQGLVSSLTAVVLVEAARWGARHYAGQASPALLDLLITNPLPGRFVAVMIAVGLAVSCTAAWFAVRQARGLRNIV